MKRFWVSIVAMLLVLSGCTHNARHSEVAAIGAQVMPFDLERTTHIFEKIDNGGVQQVLVDAPDDIEQVALIRQHLAEEADLFAKGDFHDPIMIHGDEMPGLHDLISGAKQIQIEYSEIENGGQILYTTDNSSLVSAIHIWFDAQILDHGSHAAGHH